MKMCVVVVDMLNDFVTGALKCERAKKIIPNIKSLLSFARKKGASVIYANDAHEPDVDKEFKIWPPHAVAGTKGAEVINELKPLEGDYVVKKQTYSAFYNTNLDSILQKLNVDTIALVGLTTNVCIQHTAADTFFRGYKIIIPEDCVEAPTEEAQKSGIEYLRTIYGCKITNVEELTKTGDVEANP